MQTSNFLFLEKQWPKLAELGKHSEQYVFIDPQSAIVKLRCFAELLVGKVYRELNLPIPETDNFFEKLNNNNFQNAVERPIQSKLHAIRMKGNKAAHQGGVTTEDALWLLKEAYLIGCWFYITQNGRSKNVLPKFIEPKSKEQEQENLISDNTLLKEKINTQKEDLQRALEELRLAQVAERKIQQKMKVLNKKVDLNRIKTFKKASNQAAATIDFQETETRRRCTIQDIFAEYTLTDGQSDLVNQLNDFLTSKDDNVFLLKGYAGTGKTFITKGLTEYFRAIGRNYILSAPTGKASKVIANKTKSPAYTVHKTIYAFKNIVEYQDDDIEGSETFKFYAKLAVNEHSSDTVYIVDEASLVSDVYQEAEFFRFGSGFLLRDLLKFINLDHNDHTKKIIFIGDDAQLPPVGMAFSPALDSDYLLKAHNVESSAYELTEVVRQRAKSGVMCNSTIIRHALNEGVFNQLDIDLNHSDIEHVDYQNLMPKYLQSCNGTINAESIVIAHSNRDVAEYNQRIREHFFPNHKQITCGDKVMAVTNSDKNGFFISNGDFGLVRKILDKSELRKIPLKRRTSQNRVETILISLTFCDVELGFKDLEGKPHFFSTKIIENLLYSDQPRLSSDETKALYVDFCMRHKGLKRGQLEFRETLREDPYFNAMRLKFGYAITCHKAQGSEWNHVFIKCKTHQDQLSADYFRWLYTAMTRTVKNLYLLDEPHIKIGSRIKMVNVPMPPVAKMKNFNQEVLEKDEVPSALDETFGIPDDYGFLLSILENVRNSIKGFNVSISEIQHNQYQEAYIFKQDNEFVRINMSYNSKNKITSIVSDQTTEIANHIVSLLTPLKARVLTNNVSSSEKSKNFEFPQPFLQQFHERLVSICETQNIRISDVDTEQFFQRYTFSKSNDIAVFNIYYNGKNQFTKCMAQYNISTSKSLVNELTEAISGGLFL